MHRSELRHFEQVLQTILDGTEDALLKRDDIAIENAPDALDCIQRATERDLAICRIESDFGRLQSVRTALQADRGRHLWDLLPVRMRDRRETLESRALDLLLPVVPGFRRSPEEETTRVWNWRVWRPHSPRAPEPSRRGTASAVHTRKR